MTIACIHRATNQVAIGQGANLDKAINATAFSLVRVDAPNEDMPPVLALVESLRFFEPITHGATIENQSGTWLVRVTKA